MYCRNCKNNFVCLKIPDLFVSYMTQTLPWLLFTLSFCASKVYFAAKFHKRLFVLTERWGLKQCSLAVISRRTCNISGQYKKKHQTPCFFTSLCVMHVCRTNLKSVQSKVLAVLAGIFLGFLLQTKDSGTLPRQNKSCITVKVIFLNIVHVRSC